MNRINIHDTVMVISGKDKGKKGEIIEILPKKDKVMVKGVSVVAKHYKARRQGETSGIKRIESYIDISNVMPVCKSCNKPTRVNFNVAHDKKVRVCVHCRENF